MARTYNYVKASAANIALDNQLQADFLTGPFSHKVLFGVDYFNLRANTDYRSAGIVPIDAYLRSTAPGFPPSRRWRSRSSFVTTSSRRPAFICRIRSSSTGGR